MKNRFRFIILNENSEFNYSFYVNNYIGVFITIVSIVMLGLSGWGMYRIINPHQSQQYINNADGLKFDVLSLLNELAETSKIDTTLLNKYNLKNQYGDISSLHTPVKGIVTKGISNKKNHHHFGIDIAAKMNTKVQSIQVGFVIFSGLYNDYGNTIIVAHPNDYYSIYSHLNKSIVKQRDYVKKGETIGYVGDTGESNGPHLHFEMWKNHVIIDPRNLIKEYKEKDVSIE